MREFFGGSAGGASAGGASAGRRVGGASFEDSSSFSSSFLFLFWKQSLTVWHILVFFFVLKNLFGNFWVHIGSIGGHLSVNLNIF